MVHNFSLRDGVACAQIVLFSPAVFYAWRFWTAGRIGWFCIGVFSILRIVGASTRLASINNSSDSLSTTTYVCESLGIILLIFLYQEFTERINKVQHIVHKYYFTAVSCVMLLELGLSIGGWVTMSSREDDVLLPTAWTVASSVLVACVFVYEVGLFAWFWRAQSEPTFGPEERRLLLAPAIQTFPMLIRNIHPLIFVGTGSLFWNQVVGNGYVYLFMIMIPEVAVIAVAVWCIREVAPLPKRDKKQRSTNPKRGDREDRSASDSDMPLQSEAPAGPERQSLRRRDTP